VPIVVAALAVDAGMAVDIDAVHGCWELLYFRFDLCGIRLYAGRIQQSAVVPEVYGLLHLSRKIPRSNLICRLLTKIEKT
jgi:hypothetical protein